MLVAFLVGAFLDCRFYFVEHHSLALSSATIVPVAIFIILFFLRSPWAWTAAVAVVAILAAALLLTYHLGYMGFPLTWPLAIIDLVIFGWVFWYLWRRRDPYLRYVARKDI
jgi:hypothetical protein